jgi:hypothetical protein
MLKNRIQAGILNNPGRATCLNQIQQWACQHSENGFLWGTKATKSKVKY